jgi:hypothetical protein
MSISISISSIISIISICSIGSSSVLINNLNNEEVCPVVLAS